MHKPKHLLFVCTENHCRSPSAEYLFKDIPGLLCRSAGISKNATVPINYALMSWADLIICFEDQHEQALRESMGVLVPIVNVNIPDEYGYLDAELMQLLRIQIPPHVQKLISDDPALQYVRDRAEVERLVALDPMPDTLEGRRLLMLAESVEAYEKIHFPIGEKNA